MALSSTCEWLERALAYDQAESVARRIQPERLPSLENLGIYELLRRRCKLILPTIWRAVITQSVGAIQTAAGDWEHFPKSRKLVNIAGKMLVARMMINANNTALQDSKNTFDSIRGDITANELAGTVIDRFVLIGTRLNAIIGACLISVEHRTSLNLFDDSGMGRFLVRTRHRHHDCSRWQPFIPSGEGCR